MRALLFLYFLLKKVEHHFQYKSVKKKEKKNIITGK